VAAPAHVGTIYEKRKGYVKTKPFLAFLFMQTLYPSNKNKFLRLSGNEIKRQTREEVATLV
jgi:hypothetical protein